VKRNGFTLLETIFCFAISLILLGSFPLLLSVIETESSYDTFTQAEWDTFIAQTSIELREAEEVSIYKSLLQLSPSDQNIVVQYEKYGHLVRRRVNGLGHEITLRNIHSLSFSAHSPKIITIAVESLNGKVYEAVIPLYGEQL
jgi:competence protein ComGF